MFNVRYVEDWVNPVYGEVSQDVTGCGASVAVHKSLHVCHFA